MSEVVLHIGDVKACSYSATLSCFGLSSCIGLFIQDRISGVAGGAHIFLPDNEAAPRDGKFYSVVSAIDELLKQFQGLGSNLMGLRAKAVGGGNVFSSNFSVGEQNIKSVITHLTQRKIYIAALEVGGTQGRSAKFNTITGQLQIRTIETKQQIVV